MIINCAVVEPDTIKPEIKITYPTQDVVVGDTLLIRVEASDNEGIARIEYYFDAQHDSTGDDTSEPYEHLLALDQFTLSLGGRHTLFAKAFDEVENEMISNFVRVYYKWIELIVDENEPFKRDIYKIFIRNTDVSLQFRLEYHGEWSDPYQKLSGINCAIFLDTDSDAATGMPQDTVQTLYDSFLTMNDSLRYSAADIGPDYMIVIGLEGDGVWKWDAAGVNWTFFDSPQFVSMVKDTSFFEIGVNLKSLQIEESLDIVTANITYTPDETFWDWVPDNGHIRYDKNAGLYIGK
ncbi:hypothetical protein JXO59_00670 [candidate division KSB1 bacterium]|nr:hypothetical protein [candidate division KSB1 bacterium]